MRRFVSIVIAAVALSLSAKAQFSVPGVDPPGKWRQIKTQHYQVIYKAGADSLAVEYAKNLEAVRPSVGLSAGMSPGQFTKKQLPVVLHTDYVYSNGSVTWAPKRMELYTLPQAFDPEATVWMKQLTVHESRHVAQMQLGYRGVGKVMKVLIGEMWPGAVAALYPNSAFLEGDAVVAETALTNTGRGRTADFLNYYQAAFDEGDYRNWWRWRYGSFKYYSPDHYTLGYMTIAGARAFYDDPLFTKKYFDHVTRHPFSIGNLQKQMKKASGMRFKSAWKDIELKFQQSWERPGPFVDGAQLTPTPSYALEYSNLVFADGKLYAVRQGKTYSPELVTIDSGGKVSRKTAFYRSCSQFNFDPENHRIYWSAPLSDLRWGLGGKSAIQYYDTRTGKIRTLNDKERLFNPSPSEDGSAVSAVRYPKAGGCDLVVLDALTGAILQSCPAPQGVQLTETTWIREDIYALGIAEEGFGIWKNSKGTWKLIHKPSVKTLGNFGSENNFLEFVSDADGSSQFYRMSPDGKKVWKQTTVRWGGDNFCTDGENVYYTSFTQAGRMVFSLPISQLKAEKANISKPHVYPVAEKLSAQEKEIIASAAVSDGESGAMDLRIKPYYRFPQLLHLHSWAPAYVNIDNVDAISMDTYYRTASLGVTGFFQNALGTCYGYLGYSAHPDPDTAKPWRHSGHGKFTYQGLYPVIEASFDFGDRLTHNYVFASYGEDIVAQGWLGKNLYVHGNVSAYVPFNLSNGRVSAGLVPKVSYSVGNDMVSTSMAHFQMADDMPILQGFDKGEWVPFQTLSASVRGYAMLPRAESQPYPRLGIGAEAGISQMLGLDVYYSPSVYGYVYGYLPGITRTQGLRLSALATHSLAGGLLGGAGSISTLPRGISAAPLDAYPTQVRASLDYAISIFVGDMWWLSPVVYGKNLTLTPHADFTAAAGPSGTALLWSAGADLTVALANLLWIPFDFSVGVRVDYNGATGLPTPVRPVTVNFLFDYDF